MQIREMNLKELDTVYEVLSHLRDNLSFKEFDDLVYDMRHMEYTMIGVFQRGELVTYAGVAVQTTFVHKRHLVVFDLVTKKSERRKGYAKEMLSYLQMYAKSAMCTAIVLQDSLENEATKLFLQKQEFLPISKDFVKKL